MATSWGDAARELAQILEDETIYEADTNPADLNIPGYWVSPVSRTFETLGGDYTAVFDVYAIADLAAPAEALDQLSAMQDALNDLSETHPGLHGLGTTAEIEAIILSGKSPDALPAIKITITLEVE